MTVVWNRSKTIDLIKIFKRTRILWDNKLPLYQDRELREKMIGQIAKRMKIIIPNATPEIIKLKLHSLRSQYRKQCRRLRPGAKPSLWCYHLLEFLPEPRQRCKSYKDYEDYLEEENEYVAITSNSNEMDADPIEFDSFERNSCNEIHLEIQKLPEPTITESNNYLSDYEKEYLPKHQERNPQCDAICTLIKNDLEGAPEHVFYQTKWKILELLNELELKHIKNKNEKLILKALKNNK